MEFTFLHVHGIIDGYSFLYNLGLYDEPIDSHSYIYIVWLCDESTELHSYTTFGCMMGLVELHSYTIGCVMSLPKNLIGPHNFGLCDEYIKFHSYTDFWLCDEFIELYPYTIVGFVMGSLNFIPI